MKIYIADMIGCVGAGCVTCGLGMIYFPAAPIFIGLFLLWLGIFGAGFRGRK